MTPTQLANEIVVSGPRSRLTHRIVWVLAAAGFAAYFAAAGWLRYGFVDPRPKGALVMRLKPPFERHRNAVVSRTNILPLALLADDERIKYDARSPLIVYEDTVPLGPAHNTLDDIGEIGRGRFTHWPSLIAFSASDNSDPNTNGRRYWAVLP